MRLLLYNQCLSATFIVIVAVIIQCCCSYEYHTGKWFKNGLKTSGFKSHLCSSSYKLVRIGNNHERLSLKLYSPPRNEFNTIVDSIKANVRLSDIIKHYVDVVKTYNLSEFLCLCPFHNDNRPSMQITDAKGLYHCFSCNAGGNAVSFVREIEKVSFLEAIEIIQNIAPSASIRSTLTDVSNHTITSSYGTSSGIKRLSFMEVSPESSELFIKKAHMKSVLQKAAVFYSSKLMKDVKGGIAREYIKKRGLSPRVVFDFQLGYAPYEKNWKDALIGNLTREGTSLIDMEEAGLIKAASPDIQANLTNSVADDIHAMNAYQNSVYDRFRDRIMIPIRDNHGSVIGFGGRLIGNKDSPSSPSSNHIPKYLNSPDSILFKKGSGLYGMDVAKRFIQAADCAVIVEGYFDVLTLHDCGVKNVVGSLGTALNSDQLELAAKFSKRKKVILLFDNDEAGENAARRICSHVISSANDVNLQVASFANAAAIHNKYHIERTKISDDVHIKDASDLLDVVEDRVIVADMVARLMSSSIGWKEWMVDDIAQSHGILSVAAGSIPRPSDFSRAVNDVMKFVSYLPSPADRSIVIYYAAQRLSGENVQLGEQLRIDLFKMVDGDNERKPNESMGSSRPIVSKPYQPTASGAVISTKIQPAASIIPPRTAPLKTTSGKRNPIQSSSPSTSLLHTADPSTHEQHYHVDHKATTSTNMSSSSQSLSKAKESVIKPYRKNPAILSTNPPTPSNIIHPTINNSSRSNSNINSTSADVIDRRKAFQPSQYHQVTPKKSTNQEKNREPSMSVFDEATLSRTRDSELFLLNSYCHYDTLRSTIEKKLTEMQSYLDDGVSVWRIPTHSVVWKLMTSFVEAGNTTYPSSNNDAKFLLSEELRLFKDGFKTPILDPTQKVVLDTLSIVLLPKSSKTKNNNVERAVELAIQMLEMDVFSRRQA